VDLAVTTRLTLDNDCNSTMLGAPVSRAGKSADLVSQATDFATVDNNWAIQHDPPI
jgi:hypothetical protein